MLRGQCKRLLEGSLTLHTLTLGPTLGKGPSIPCSLLARRSKLLYAAMFPTGVTSRSGDLLISVGEATRELGRAKITLLPTWRCWCIALLGGLPYFSRRLPGTTWWAGEEADPAVSSAGLRGGPGRDNRAVCQRAWCPKVLAAWCSNSGLALQRQAARRSRR